MDKTLGRRREREEEHDDEVAHVDESREESPDDEGERRPLEREPAAGPLGQGITPTFSLV